LQGRFTLSLAILAALSSATAVSAQTKGGASKPARIHFTVAPTGNEARYRVREQLAGFDLPNDAIGATKDIAGRIVVDPSGKVLKDSSKIVVTLTELKSDKTRRDNFLKTRTLETQKFPQVELVPVTFEGLAEPIPAGQSRTFSLVGDLTVRGVTRPTTWHVTARADGKDIVGTASTSFTFKDFNLDQPRVPVVLSVADTIKLEYDFHFAPTSP
jgi:polyisoprenoid-binding protein YceI